MNTNVMTRDVAAITLAFFALALFALIPQTSSAHGGTTGAASTTCMAGAIDDREDALMEAWAAMHTSTLNALTERRDALMTAWGLTEAKARNAAVVKAWKAWRTDKKELTAEFRKDRKAAWEAFKKTAKTECKVTVPKDEAQEKAASDSISI